MGTTHDVGGAVGGAVGGSIGDLVGYFLSMGDRDSARAALMQANPTITPQMVESKLNSLDPSGRSAQMEAIGRLKQVYSSGGLDPQAKAQMAAAESSADRNAQALQGNIQNQMAQRGMMSSGSDYALQQKASGDAADRAYMGDVQAAGMGAERAQNATNSAMGGAGMMRGQDINQAEGQDAISRFNAENSMNAQQNTFQNQLAKSGVYQDWANKTQKQAHDVGAGAGAGIGTAATLM